MKRGHNVRSFSEPVMSRSSWQTGMLNTMLCCQSRNSHDPDLDDRLYQMLLCDKNAEIEAEHVAKNKTLFKLDASFLPR